MKEEIYKLLGDRLSANEMEKLIAILRTRKFFFSTDTRIAIQEFCEKIGKEKSGSEFETYLNKVIVPILARQIL